MAITRWILFIPIGVIASILAGYAGFWGGKMFGEFVSFTTSGCFAAVAFIAAGFKVAPLKNTFVRNILIVCALAMGVLSGIGSLLGDDKLQCTTGFSMAISALCFISISPADITKLFQSK